MFLEKYVDELYFNQILNKYNSEYLELLDENNFLEVLKVLSKYNLYFVNDIALSYLEIFEMDSNEFDMKLNKLREKYGEYFNVKIGNDIKIFDEIFD